MNKYLGYFIGLLSSKAVRAAINFLFVTLLARTLGPSGLGDWTMVLAAGALLHSFLLNWMHPTTVRFGREEWQKQNTISNSWSARLPYLLAGSMIIAVLVITDPAQWMEYFFHLSGGFRMTVLLAILWLWLSIETQNFLQLHESMLGLVLIPVIADIVPVLALTAIIISGALIPEQTLIMGLLTLSVISWFTALSWEARQLKTWFVWPKKNAVLRTFNYAWPLIPGFLIGYASDWGDQLLLRYFFTAHEVGLFQASYQVMILLLGVSTTLNTVLMPTLMDKEMLSPDNNGKFLFAAGPTMMTLGLFLLVPLVSFAPFGFHVLMGSKFARATPVLIVLCAAIPGSIISSLYGIFFNIQGRLWRSTVVYCGIMSATNITISLILLPRIGILGSAIATSVSYLIVQLLYMLDQHRYYNISSAKERILFLAILVFAVLQALIGDNLLIRLALCLLYLIALVFISRYYSLIDRGWALRILSGKIGGLGDFIVRVAVAPREGLDNA